MSYIITGTDSAGALSLKRDSALAAIKKALELVRDGCRDVSITAPDGRIYGHPDFDQLHAAEGA
jgi:LmbE family N-acetylglucosaminyl deacetylase